MNLTSYGRSHIARMFLQGSAKGLVKPRLMEREMSLHHLNARKEAFDDDIRDAAARSFGTPTAGVACGARRRSCRCATPSATSV